jgi:hypothetical protein
MKRAVRPIAHVLHMAVLNRVVVDVMHVLLDIALITQGVLPKSPLP